MAAIDAFHFLLEAVILLLLLFLALLQSYFRQKGKNLATKEDVEEITSLVESVKSQLQYSLQAKLSLRAEEHQALVDYFSKYSAWLSSITNFSIVGINKDNTSRLREIRSQLDAHKRDVELAAGKMELFVENEDIRSRHGALMMETLNFQHHTQEVTFDFEQSHFEAKLIELNTPIDKRAQQYQQLLENEHKLYKVFKDEQLKMLQTLFPLVQEQRHAISAHIRALANG